MATNSQDPDSAWEYVTALAGGLAHEIKNPLSTIKVNLQLLAEDWENPQTPKEKRTSRKLEVLQEEVQRLAQTLEDFLRFTRVERIDLRPTDINDVVAEVAEFVRPELDRANIQLLEQYAQGLPSCTADTRLLKQAILNIILNAQQAMPDGGDIIMRTSSAGRHVAIEIIDTGHGIPENLRDKVFGPFFSTKKDGSGLGLVVTKRIVDQHGGEISFVSEPGKGTDFVIRVPRADEDTDKRDQ